ncbi:MULTISPECIES: hypothetical protein [unclassified Nostoc]|nr:MULTISPECIES: hypothetical protein [unclassified Nostoc]MBD2473253.1 hypothetical protein [Nostoc sp. FACHB-145]
MVKYLWLKVESNKFNQQIITGCALVGLSFQNIDSVDGGGLMLEILL